MWQVPDSIEAVPDYVDPARMSYGAVRFNYGEDSSSQQQASYPRMSVDVGSGWGTWEVSHEASAGPFRGWEQEDDSAWQQAQSSFEATLDNIDFSALDLENFSMNFEGSFDALDPDAEYTQEHLFNKADAVKLHPIVESYGSSAIDVAGSSTTASDPPVK